MTEDQFKAAKVAYQRLQSAQQRVDYLQHNPDLTMHERPRTVDRNDMPEEMKIRHAVEYSHWAKQEFEDAQAAFASL